MRKITKKRRYKRDEKLMKIRGLDLHKLDQIVFRLASDIALDPSEKDHPLQGSASRYRECHISPDWLLVYRKLDDQLILELCRTGTHADLFKR